MHAETVRGGSWLAVLLLAAACLLDDSEAFAEPPAGTDIEVRVQRTGDAYVVDASIFVGVAASEAWAVLTDFDGMAKFVPNVMTSRAQAESGKPLIVRQTGEVRYGLLRFPFESVRAIEMQPEDSIRASSLSGSVKRGETLMRLSAEKDGTRMNYHAEFVPAGWMPAALGPTIIRHEVAEQFAAIAAEMLRRHRSAQ